MSAVSVRLGLVRPWRWRSLPQRSEGEEKLSRRVAVTKKDVRNENISDWWH